MLTSIEKGNYSTLKDVKILEITNNKLTDFCKRVVNVEGYEKHDKLTSIYVVLIYLERIADEYRDICTALQGRKQKINSKFAVHLKEVSELFNILYKSFYKFERVNIEKVFQNANPIQEKILKDMLNAKNEECVALHHLSNVVSGIYELATANLELNV